MRFSSTVSSWAWWNILHDMSGLCRQTSRLYHWLSEVSDSSNNSFNLVLKDSRLEFSFNSVSMKQLNKYTYIYITQTDFEHHFTQLFQIYIIYITHTDFEHLFTQLFRISCFIKMDFLQKMFLLYMTNKNIEVVLFEPII